MSVEQEYIVTARKWRPQEFDAVVGQVHITQTLNNAIANNRIHHAYLFTGPRGVGKTTTARIYAKEVIQYGINQKDPDSKIDVSSLDSLEIIEIDGASNNSVEDIRSLRENSKYPPSIGKYKIYIIDEVHMLSTAAFNALLKTLEEPPPHLLFVFATTEPHKVPATIISRCQRFDFRRMSITDIVSQLQMIAEKDGITIDEQSLITIAKKADGSMRDSQSIFDQAVAFCGTEIEYKSLASALNLIDEDFYFKITDNIVNPNPKAMFEIAAQVNENGYDLRETLSGLLEHFRNILSISVGSKDNSVEASQDSISRYKTVGSALGKLDIIRILDHITESEKNIRFSLQPFILFELCLVQLALMDRTETLNEIIAELRDGIPEKKNFNVIVESAPAEKVKTTTPVVKPKEIIKEEIPLPVEEIEPIVEIKEEVQTTVSTKKSISEQELKDGWGAFLSNNSTVEGFKILADTLPKFLNGTIILMTDNSFIKSTLERKKAQLIVYLNDHYSADIDLKFEHFESSDTSIKSGKDYLVEYSGEDKSNDSEIESLASVTIDTVKPYEKKSDIEKFIIDNFNAEEQVG